MAVGISILFQFLSFLYILNIIFFFICRVIFQRNGTKENVDIEKEATSLFIVASSVALAHYCDHSKCLHKKKKTDSLCMNRNALRQPTLQIGKGYKSSGFSYSSSSLPRLFGGVLMR